MSNETETMTQEIKEFMTKFFAALREIKCHIEEFNLHSIVLESIPDVDPSMDGGLTESYKNSLRDILIKEFKSRTATCFEIIHFYESPQGYREIGMRKETRIKMKSIAEEMYEYIDDIFENDEFTQRFHTLAWDYCSSSKDLYY